MIGQILIRCNLGDFCPSYVIKMVGTIICLIVEIEVTFTQVLRPVSLGTFPSACSLLGCADIHFRPAKEGVAIPGGSGGNVIAFVDYRRVYLDICIRTVVLIPIDMRRRRLLGIDIHCLELNGILVSIRRIARRCDCLYFCICSQDLKGLTRVHLCFSVCPSSLSAIGCLVPSLNNPIGELLPSRSRYRSSSGGKGAVHIGIGIACSSGAAVQIINNANAGSTV